MTSASPHRREPGRWLRLAGVAGACRRPPASNASTIAAITRLLAAAGHRPSALLELGPNDPTNGPDRPVGRARPARSRRGPARASTVR